MKLFLLTTAFALATASLLSATEKTEGAEIEHTEVVESGTYKVTAHKVDPEEKEIYVKTDDGKILELYLKKHTVITKGDTPATFDALKEGQKLEIKVERKEKKLNPLAVKILE